jgi:hypothetical protein
VAGSRGGAWAVVRWKAEVKSPNVRRLQSLMLGCDTGDLLQELQDRGVIEALGGHPSADRPRGTMMHGTRKPPPIGKPLDELALCTREGRGRGHVVEDAVFLDVVEDEDGLGPHFRVGGNGLDLASYEIGASGGHVVGVLRLVTGGDDPGDGGQTIVTCIVLEIENAAPDHAPVVKRLARLRITKPMKEPQHVATVIVDLLIKFSTHSGLLKLLGVGSPRIGLGRDISDDMSTVVTLGIDGPGHPVQAIMPRRTHDRTVLAITDSEGLG